MRDVPLIVQAGPAATFAAGTTGVSVQCDERTNECTMQIAPFPVGFTATCQATECYDPFGDILLSEAGTHALLVLLDQQRSLGSCPS